MRVLTVKGNGEFTAGPKAPSDVIEILQKKYNAKSILLEGGENFWGKIKYRMKMYATFIGNAFNNDVLVIQFPMYETTNTLNKLFLFFLSFTHKNKTIALIHDIDGIRENNEIHLKQDVDRLNKVGYVIAHNPKMNEKLKELGVKSKLFNLNVFDYLCNTEEEKDKDDSVDLKRIEVAYAGNLSEVKSPFLYQLDNNKMDFVLNLYGNGIEKDINSKMIYKGKRKPNDLPNDIEGNLGLIWDGNYDESDQNVGFKNYTKYNNPHKLSCYIAAGKPVIVWHKAAIADFVKQNNIGYTITNLYDINKLDFSDYNEKLTNIKILKEKVRGSYYTVNVMEQILKEINN